MQSLHGSDCRLRIAGPAVEPFLRRPVSIPEAIFLLALGANGIQALAVEVDELLGVILGAGRGAALKAGSGGGSAAISGGGSDELHHLKRNLLVASHGRGGGSMVGRLAQADTPALGW